MRTGDTLLFELDGMPHRAELKAVLFTGTSRWLPDGRVDPWRELLIVEAQSGSVITRDRMRVRNGETKILSAPTWSVGTVDSIVELLLSRSRDAPNVEQARLLVRGLTALERWSRAETV